MLQQGIGLNANFSLVPLQIDQPCGYFLASIMQSIQYSLNA